MIIIRTASASLEPSFYQGSCPWEGTGKPIRFSPLFRLAFCLLSDTVWLAASLGWLCGTCPKEGAQNCCHHNRYLLPDKLRIVQQLCMDHNNVCMHLCTRAFSISYKQIQHIIDSKTRWRCWIDEKAVFDLSTITTSRCCRLRVLLFGILWSESQALLGGKAGNRNLIHLEASASALYDGWVMLLLHQPCRRPQSDCSVGGAASPESQLCAIQYACKN